MSIVVDKNKLFNYQFNGKFKYLNDQVIGFKIDENGDVSLNFIFTGRDFETMSKIIEDCSIINSVTGKPLLRSGLFTKLILLNFVKEINLVSEFQNFQISVNQSTLNNLHYDIVKCIAMKWLELTDGA